MARPHISRRFAAVAASAVLASTAVAVSTTSGASAAPRPTVSSTPAYLALGDSVTFGYRESANLPTPDYTNASNFVGYPEDVAAATGLKLANLSCPGETSASFVTAGAPSNGCEDSPGGGPGYRTAFPLHVSYTGTQLQKTTNYLRHHPETRLVSLMIGANDGFLCQETTADHCASEIGPLLTSISNNVSRILRAVRHSAGYEGQIIILTYYSLNYSDPTQVALSKAVNFALLRGATPWNVTVADGYAAFETAAAQSGGDSCKAGLLTQLTTGGCGVHPSVGGQALLALAVQKAIQR